MGNRFKKRGSDPPNSNPATVLTAPMFFGKVGNLKYFDPEEFLVFGDKMRDEDEAELSAFFDLVKEGLKMAINRRTQTDRGGLTYTYENFIRSKGPEGVKVVLSGKLYQFIKDYQNGKFITDFTLDDLIAEAEKDR